MDRLDGASAGFGFSTIFVMAKALPLGWPTPTTPYMWMRSAGTSSTAMILALSSRSYGIERSKTQAASGAIASEKGENHHLDHRANCRRWRSLCGDRKSVG